MVRRSLVAALTALLSVATFGCSAHSPNTASSGAAPSAAPTVTPGGNLLNDVRQRGTLIIATDPNYSPQSLRRPDGSWTGFDVEVGREIARRLGVRPMFEAANFNLVVRGHWLGKWDINVGSMSVTHDRTQVLWFSKPYYIVPGLFAVRSTGSIDSLAGLAGKRIGVTAATTFESFVRGKLRGRISISSLHLRVVPYDADIQALSDLAAGNGRKIDAVLSSLPTLNAAIAKGMPVRIIGKPVFEDRPAVALDRSSFHESLDLLFAIDGIIDAMHRDGTLRRLSLKYYGLDLSDY